MLACFAADMKNSPMPQVSLIAGILISIGISFLMAGETLAAPKGDGDSDIVKTLNKAQGMLRQLSQEKTALESKVAEMQKSLDDTTAQLAAKSAENQKLQTDFKQQSASLLVQQKNNQILTKNNEILKGNADKLREQLAQGQELLVQARNQGAQLSGELRTSLSDNELLVNAVKERTEWIQKTTDKNNQLVRSYREVLENFRNRSFLDTLAEAEPITGIASVAKENKIEEYRYKLNALKITPWQDGVGAGSPPPPESR
jgi:peptidoglycan hydrolase CwlO-like protein